MQSVAAHVPEAIILAIGSAKATGRDRWWQLSKLLQVPGNADEGGRRLSESDDFAAETGDARFTLAVGFPGEIEAPGESSGTGGQSLGGTGQIREAWKSRIAARHLRWL